MTLVLSGTARVVRSGTAESSYREPGLLVTTGNHTAIPAPSNHANRKESFGFLLTHRGPVDIAVAFRRYIGCEIDVQMAARAIARIDAALPLGSPLPKLNPPSGETP